MYGRNAPGTKEWADSGQFQRMRSEIPPPGPAMTFSEWSEAIVDGVRAYLPDAQAARKARDSSSSATAIARRISNRTARRSRSGLRFPPAR